MQCSMQLPALRGNVQTAACRSTEKSVQRSNRTDSTAVPQRSHPFPPLVSHCSRPPPALPPLLLDPLRISGKMLRPRCPDHTLCKTPSPTSPSTIMPDRVANGPRLCNLFEKQKALRRKPERFLNIA